MKGSREWTAVGGIVGLLFLSQSAYAVDWSAAPARDVTLFYPGQASWEWVLTPIDHSGAPKFREGKNCKQCHDGEEPAIGNLLASGKKLEPTPIAGKRGSIPAKVSMAQEGGRFYVRLAWPAAEKAAAKVMDPDIAFRVTVMLDDGAIAEAGRAGCWGICHDDATGMASSQGERTKYLSRSRAKITRQGGGDNLKPQAELAQLRASGAFLEYWQARVKPDGTVVPADGTVLEKRADNATPAVTAEAKREGDNWVVVLGRDLKAPGPDHKDLVTGKTYTVGFAVHDSHTRSRFHHVSLEHSLVLGKGTADFVVTGN